jgi:trehalose/maltose transport system substrate-binding protein
MQRAGTGGGADLSRKDFLRLGGAGLAGAALFGVAGCGGGTQSSGNELILAMGKDDTGTWPTLIEKFNKQHEGEIKVTHREMPQDTGRYFDQLRTEFQAGGGDIDVIGGDVIWPAQFAANGWIVDLSDRFTDTDEFLPGPMEAMTYDGKVWGVPWWTDAGLLYYRSDLLEEAGFSEAPKTWEELKEMALETKRASGTQMGFAFQGAEYEGGVCNGCEYIWTHGGNILDPNDPSKVVVDSPESADGLQTWHSMIEDGVSTKAVLNYTETESYGAFLRGDAIFLRNWPYVYALLSDPEQSDINPAKQVGVAPIPVSGGNPSFSTIGGWNFFINAASDKQEEAWEFIKFMTDPEQMKTNALGGSRLPPRRSLYEDQEVLEKVPVARLGKEAIIDNGTPRPVSPYYSDMSLKLAEQFNGALAGDVSPEQAVKALQKELQQIVEEGQAAG